MDSNRSKKGFLRRFGLVLLLFILLDISAGVGLYYYSQYHRIVAAKDTTTNETQTKAIIAQVGKLMLLPKDEEPTIANVTDVSKLKGESFFQDAANGDKVLIYQKARKAILYDPKANIIVDVASIGSPQISLTPIPTLTPTPTPKKKSVSQVTSTPTPTH